MFERLIWVVPLIVAALGAWRPRAGLVALAAALPLFGSPPGGPYLAALDVAAIAAILTAWRGGRAAPSALSWPVAAFVAVSLASLVPSPYLPPAWRPSILLGVLRALPGVEGWPALYAWRAAADLLLGWGLFLAVRRAFSGRSLMPLARGLLAGLATTVVVGLVSHAGLLSLDAYRPTWVLANRLASLFFLSGWLSQYLVIGAPVALAGLYLSGRGLRALGPLFLALLAVCLVLTYQRGAWAAALAGLLYWLANRLRSGAWDRARLRHLAIAGGVTTTLAAIVLAGFDNPLDQLLDRLRSLGAGLGPRQAVWEAATEMVRLRPMLGWGLGSFGPAYDLLHPPGSEGAAPLRGTAHSLYLHVLAERGILGLAALGLLGWTAAVCLRRPRQSQENLARVLAASLIVAAVYGLVQYVFYLRNIALLLWMLIACVTLVSRCEGQVRVRRAGRILTLVAVLLLPIRGLLVDAPPYAGNQEYGFHEVESVSPEPFQWTERWAARRLPWAGETLVLSLANGHPRAGARPINVAIGIDGRTVARLTLAGGWEEHRFELGLPAAEWTVLTLDARPTFRPFSDYRQYPDQPPSVDIRLLGVAVREPRWE